MDSLARLIQENNFVAIDVETTGLNISPEEGEVARIIKIEAVKIEKGKITDKFFTFVACSKPLSPAIVELTGITDRDLAGAPTIDEALKRLSAFCKDCFLVAHNIPFDLRFLNYYGKTCGVVFDQKAYDTLPLAKEILGGELPNYKIATLAAYFNVKSNNSAWLQAKMFLELAKWQCFLAYINCVKKFD